jgi:hypothetical protein
LAGVSLQLTSPRAFPCRSSRATRWTTSFHSSNEPSDFRPKTLPLKGHEPDFALGLQLGFGKATEGTSSQSTTQPPFSAFWEAHHAVHAAALAVLEKHHVTTLHARPATQAMLVYPCFTHVVRNDWCDLWVAGNQLAGSLAFALDQQEELRLLAGVPVEERMPVFGAVSCGTQLVYWYGAHVGSDIVSLTSRSCPVTC